MSVSSGTVNLFAGVAIAIAAASAGAYALRNPDRVNAAIAGYVDEWRSRQASGLPANGADVSSRPARQPGEVVLRSGDNGHFETEVEINGRPIDVLVDTGASMVAMTYEDAERAGIFVRPADFTHQASTANGMAKIAPVRIGKIQIGDIVLFDVRGAVSEPGALHKSLLGMSFIGRLSRFDMRDDSLVLAE